MEDLNVLIAPDSFKGSASSRRVAELIERGVRHVLPGCHVQRFVIADGGEGTVEALVSARGGSTREIAVSGPLGEPELACYGLVDGDTAVIEVAQTSGITLVEPNALGASRASSRGVGQAIITALDAGARHVLVGLGGSAISDGGAGMAQALGAHLLDATGAPIEDGLAGLEHLASIDCSGIDPRILDVEFTALTDVTNPLCGPNGAVLVYGPQKGLDGDLERFDGWMASYARVLESALGYDVANLPGAGAAGGLGAALVAFCHAQIVHGIDYVLEAIGLEQTLRGIDLVITGEGHMDAQSAFGKAPVGVARIAKRHDVPVVAVVGSRADDVGGVYEAGINLVVPAVTQPCSLEECLSRVDTSIPLAAETAIRAFLLGR